MTLNDALKILMRAAERDVRGSGLGFRETSDEWRSKVAEAWTVAFKRVNARSPSTNEYFNAGMRAPTSTTGASK